MWSMVSRIRAGVYCIRRLQRRRPGASTETETETAARSRDASVAAACCARDAVRFSTDWLANDVRSQNSGKRGRTPRSSPGSGGQEAIWWCVVGTDPAPWAIAPRTRSTRQRHFDVCLLTFRRNDFKRPGIDLIYRKRAQCDNAQRLVDVGVRAAGLMWALVRVIFIGSLSNSVDSHQPPLPRL